MSHFVAEVP